MLHVRKSTKRCNLVSIRPIVVKQKWRQLLKKIVENNFTADAIYRNADITTFAYITFMTIVIEYSAVKGNSLP